MIKEMKIISTTTFLNSEGEASTSVILSLHELIKNDVFIKGVKEVVIKCVDIKLKDSKILNDKQLTTQRNIMRMR